MAADSSSAYLCDRCQKVTTFASLTTGGKHRFCGGSVVEVGVVAPTRLTNTELVAKIKKVQSEGSSPQTICEKCGRWWGHLVTGTHTLSGCTGNLLDVNDFLRNAEIESKPPAAPIMPPKPRMHPEHSQYYDDGAGGWMFAPHGLHYDDKAWVAKTSPDASTITWDSLSPSYIREHDQLRAVERELEQALGVKCAIKIEEAKTGKHWKAIVTCEHGHLFTTYWNSERSDVIGDVSGYASEHRDYLRSKAADLARRSVLQTLEADATEAAWRTAGTQLVKLVREPLVATLQRHLAPGDEAFRAKLAAFLDTELGAAILSALISVGLSLLPGQPDVSERLARELRVGALATVGDLLVDLLMAPLRQVLVTYLQGELPTPAMLNSGEKLPRFDEAKVAVEA